MWADQIDISLQVENKNRFIQNTDKQWIGFVDGTVSTEEEMRQVLEENPFLEEYDVLLFGDNIPKGECSFWELLTSPESVIYALYFRRELLIYTGSFNELLPGSDTYELLLRLAERGSVYSIPCSADKEMVFQPITMAYIIRRYMKIMKNANVLDDIFLCFMQQAERLHEAGKFRDSLNLFLGKEEEYERIASDTAPCLVLITNDGCYGVVKEFGEMLADALVSMGQAVITTSGTYGDYHSIATEELINQVYKAIIGFQSPAFEKSIFANIKGKKYQFWFDNPLYSIEHFASISKNINILCHDADYARYMREHYGMKNVVQFPLAAKVSHHDRSEFYDLVFVGKYLSYKEPNFENEFQNTFYQYMMSNPQRTVEQGIRAIWQKQGIAYNEELFMETVISLWEVCYNLLQNYRHKVVESILGAGIKMHVFGDTWQEYKGDGRENLIYHPEVCGEEALQVWSNAKIGLNIMNGHKHGMTERIANIMLCGACCLSDETSYLKENFRDGEEIVLFDANELEKLPDKIQYFLQHDDERRSIARAGQKKARIEHTWRKRAEQLLNMIEVDLDEGN